MVKINLLPDLVLERRREARIKKLATTALIGWTGLILLITGAVFGYSQYQEAVLADTREAHDELDAEVNSDENVAFRKKALAVQTSLDALSELFNSRRSAAEFFETIAAYTPENVRISELVYGEDNAVIINGIARSYGAISTFESALKESSDDATSDADTDDEANSSEQTDGYFTNIALLGANISDEKEVRFELRATYVPPPPESTDEAETTTEDASADGADMEASDA